MSVEVTSLQPTGTNIGVIIHLPSTMDIRVPVYLEHWVGGLKPIGDFVGSLPSTLVTMAKMKVFSGIQSTRNIMVLVVTGILGGGRSKILPKGGKIGSPDFYASDADAVIVWLKYRGLYYPY